MRVFFQLVFLLRRTVIVASMPAYCDCPLVADLGFLGFLGFFLCSVCGGEYDDAVVLLAGCAKATGLDARTAAAITRVAADVSFFMRLSP
jgi:hypothetical protein